MVQTLFDQLVTAVYAIHDLKCPVVGLAATLLQPAHELRGLFVKSNAHEGVESERRVTDPGVTVVPVALSPSSSGRLHVGDATMAPVGSKAISFRARADRVHYLAPAAGVGTPGQPALPVVNRHLEQLLGLRLSRHYVYFPARVDLIELEHHRLPLA